MKFNYVSETKKRRLLWLLYLTFYFSCINNAYSQTVTTLIGENVGDDMHYATDGFIYASDYGGQAIRKINPTSGTFETILVPPVSTIGAIEVNDSLEVFVTSYDDGWFGSFFEGDPSITQLFGGIPGPAGIAFDNLGNKFITANAAHAILKIDSNNNVTTFAQSTPLFWPTGITTDDQNNIYTTNLFNGGVVKTDTSGNSTLLASLPSIGSNNFILGYLVWNDGALYVCHVYDHVIYKIDDTTGNFQIIAGQEGAAGGQDGIGTNASFHNPTGIEISPDGGTLYVTDGEASAKRLRTILLTTLSVNEYLEPIAKAYPSPVSDEITIGLLNISERDSTLVIHDANGKFIKELKVNLSNGQNTINVKDLKPGLYFLSVSKEGSKQTIKFIKN